MSEQAPWTVIAASARRRLFNSIPTEWRIPPGLLPPETQLNVMSVPMECGILSQHEVDITESSAVEVVQKLAKAEWTSLDVTTAFCKRAAVAHQLTNCLTVTMFDDAIRCAKAADEHLKATGTVLGPLHGLPVSLKDCFNVPGYPTSVGLTAWALDPVYTESAVVTLLKNAGAIMYVKTNVPTAMMYAESANNCYGRTLNPLNRNLTPGGSSGGEAALIAMRGSCLGVGTDIGGSLRIPAACVGLYTIRPSHGRSPHQGVRTALAGQEAISSVNGPIARSLADLELWFRTIVNSKPWLHDPKALDLPYRDVVLPTKLKIAVLWHNGMVRPTPPVTRALKGVVDSLTRKEYDIIDWSPQYHAELASVCRKIFLSDGGTSIRSVLQESAEPWRPELAAYEHATDAGVYNLWQLLRERSRLQSEYLQQVLEAGVDVILGPTTPWVAPRNGELNTVGYTNVFSVLDYCSASFPTGLYADVEVDKKLEDDAALNDLDRLTQERYNPSDVRGMPISLQLTAGRLQEEKLLAILAKIVAD